MVTQSGGVLAELLARIAAAGGGVVEVPGDELEGWPQDDVAALKSHAVLLPGKPADSAICAGCERACVMQVQVLPRAGRAASLFIVCDKPVDINRVAVAPAALERWRASALGLADALARLLGSDSAVPAVVAASGFRLGVVKGRKDKAVVHLLFGEDGPRLEVAGHVIELGLVLTMQQHRVALDMRRLGRCADAPAAISERPAETPDDRRKRLAERVLREKAKGTKNFLQVVADEEGISKGRLHQILTRAKPRDAFGAMADTLIRPASKGKAKP